ncbi:hypothetical protein [Peribacillus muralis]
MAMAIPTAKRTVSVAMGAGRSPLQGNQALLFRIYKRQLSR